MNQSLSPLSSFAMLFDPSLALAAAKRAAQWDLPRRICRPLDRCGSNRLSAELAAYDAAVESALVAEEECKDEPLNAVSGNSTVLDPDDIDAL